MQMCLTQSQRKTIHHLDQYIFMSERWVQYTQLEDLEKYTHTFENAPSTKMVIMVRKVSKSSIVSKRINSVKPKNRKKKKLILYILLVSYIPLSYLNLRKRYSKNKNHQQYWTTLRSNCIIVDNEKDTKNSCGK